MSTFFKLVQSYFVVLTVLFSSNAFSQIHINEILASNITVVRDPLFNNYGDWIELYNSGDSDINLEGYYLSDNSEDPTKYEISGSNLILYSGKYKLIWMEKNLVRDNEIYTNFSLSGRGEFISLYDNNQILVDSTSFEGQLGDVSFGREKDGSAQWGYFQFPTPNSANQAPFFLSRDQVSNVEFSIESGFYDSGLTVKLSTSDQLGQIRFTLNGQIPSDSSQLYTEPINLTKTQVIRTRAFSKNKLFSPISTNTYLIGVNADISVVSLSTNSDNFYDDDYGIYIEGTNGVSGRCYSSPANWNRDWERHVNFEYFDTEKQRVINQLVGTKVSGNCTRIQKLKSLAFYARSKYGKEFMDYKFFSDKSNESYKTIVLRKSGNDAKHTLLRDGFMQTIVKDRMDIDTQGYQPSLVFFNGEFWGILNTREKINDNYIMDNYNLEDDEFDMLELFSRVSHGSAKNYIEMLDFISVNDISNDENFSALSKMMDVNEFKNYFIAQIYFGNYDWPNNNIKYWREKADHGKWRWILYDTDFGYDLVPLGNPLTHVLRSKKKSSLFISLFENESFKNDFIQTAASHMNTTFKSERCISKLDSIKVLIEAHIPQSFEVWSPTTSEDHFTDQINVMYNFANKRVNKLQKYFEEELDLSGMYNVSVKIDALDAGYVTINDVSIPEDFSGDYFSDIPIQLRAIAKPGYEFTGWTGTVNQNQQFLEVTTDSNLELIANFREIGTYSSIYINELSADNIDLAKDEYDDFGDWIEIYNANDFEVNLGGLYLTDDTNELFKYKIAENKPEETRLAANSHVIFWADDVSRKGVYHTNFKLSKSGEFLALVQLIDGEPQIIDSLTFEEQYKNASMSRYPDAAADWYFIPPTPNSTNTYDTIQNIFINEYSADNSNLLPNSLGQYEDYIELYNDNDHAVNLAGLFMTDSLADGFKSRIPSTDTDSTTIPSKGYLTLFADSEGNSVLSLDFKLGRSGEQVGLINYDQTPIDTLTYSEQYKNASISRYPDAAADWYFIPPTPNSTNTYDTIQNIFINEYSADNSNLLPNSLGQYEDYIELYNDNDHAVNLAGLFMTDSLADGFKSRIPSTDTDSTTIPSKGYLTLFADSEGNSVLSLDFKLGRSGEQVGLLNYDQTPIDTLTYSEQYKNASISRYPDAAADWYFIPPTPNSTNTYDTIQNIYINEYSADNENLLANGQGHYEDYIELYNDNDHAVNLAGLFMTDSLADGFKSRIPSTDTDSTTIPSKGYLTLFADSEGNSVLSLDFKLGRSGEQVGLLNYDQTPIDTLTYSEQYKNASISRYPDAASDWYFIPPTPNEENLYTPLSGIYLNEFMADNESYLLNEKGKYEDWIELYNDNDFEVNIGGLYFTDSLSSGTLSRIPTTFSDSTTIPAFGYMVLWADKEFDKGVLHLNFKLGASGEEIGLFGADGISIIDSIEFGRLGEFVQEWMEMNRPTPYAQNLYSISRGSIVRVYPNPFKDLVVLDYSSINSQPSVLNIINSLGEVVFQINLKESERKDRFIQWDGNNTAGIALKEGVYIYQVISDSEVVSGKLLLQR